MNILLTNDDGIDKAGLQTLYSVLDSKHTVYIIAPHEEKSACSSAINVRTPVGVTRIDDRQFSVEAYPADCINIGLHGDIIPTVDMIISGINHGPNVGNDVYFSGTVAAARTAFIFGITGIALSLNCINISDYFNDAAEYMYQFIQNHEIELKKTPQFLNINYPNISADKISGVKYTHLGERIYQDSYDVVSKNANTSYLRLRGIIDSTEIEGSDVTELKNGFISITPLKLDCTDYIYLEDIKS